MAVISSATGSGARRAEAALAACRLGELADLDRLGLDERDQEQLGDAIPGPDLEGLVRVVVCQQHAARAASARRAPEPVADEMTAILERPRDGRSA